MGRFRGRENKNIMTYSVTVSSENGSYSVFPKSFEIRSSIDTPADSFTGIFPFSSSLSLGNTIEVTSVQKERLFFGTVEDLTTVISSEGVFTEVFARSPAAALIDNEALPKTYNCPSFEDIYKNHALPYGIKSFSGENLRWQGNFSVLKGDSHWDVIKRFCLSVTGFEPFISGDLTLYSKHPQNFLPEKKLSVSNSLPGCTKFSKAEITESSFGIVGKIICKVQKEGTYAHSILNPYIKNPENYSVRIVDLTNTPLWERQNKTDRIFRLSLENTLQIEAELFDPPPIFTGMKASFSSPAGKQEENLMVFQRVLRLTSKGYYCTVILRKKDV